MDIVRSFSDFVPGQIVEFRYYLTWYYGILTKVNPTRKTITVIHYGTAHLFATKAIIEEELVVNPMTQVIYISRADPVYSYTPDEVIRNAKSRLGEQSWNRPYDFCRKCVFRE
ncbi:hypothetical protein ACJMK2_037587 [Sinanodonta woodiana]|uniref:Uncharacterized protein n=1 Tax=Sinanodonta woodiana TaxID=1069815 RepID=A0ABD3WKX7_SINWO